MAYLVLYPPLGWGKGGAGGSWEGRGGNGRRGRRVGGRVCGDTTWDGNTIDQTEPANTRQSPKLLDKVSKY